MGIADSFSQYLWFLFLTAWLFLYLGVKLLRVVDDDGAIKKTANEGFAACIKRLFK